MKRGTAIVLLCLLIGVSILRWETVSSSVVSLACFLYLVAESLPHVERYWNAGVVQYHAAALIWIGTCVWLAWIVLHRKEKAAGSVHSPGDDQNRGSTSRRNGLYVIYFMIWVSTTGPLLAPFDPAAQGNLVTMRLLPPLSPGHWELPDIEIRNGAGGSASCEDTYVAANSLLLQRAASMSGGEGGPGTRSTVFLLGTDDAGRDVFSRVIFGTRVSLAIGGLAVLGALLVGGVVGFSAGMSGFLIDGVLMRMTDLFLSVPGLFLAIGLMAFIGQSAVTLVAVLTLTGWMSAARVIRAEILSLKEREFILAARLLRVSSWRIVTRHLLPNVMPVVATIALLQFGNAVLGEAALGFLGLGIQPPTPSWGNMMGEAMGYLQRGWWVGIFPGLLLAIVLVSAHYASEG